MPQVNYTIDNTNPMIQYLPVGTWSEGSKTQDSLAYSYSNNGTFTLTTSPQSFASFTFNGTAVWFFGAKRGNHGTYSVNIDNAITQYDGFAPDPGLFRTPLFSAPSLQPGLHTVTITNTRTSDSRPYLDIDFITWTTEIGNPTGNVVQDTDPAFSYQPPSDWMMPTLDGFTGTAHASFDANSSVTYTFTGDSVTLYGATGPNASPYSVQVDGHSPSNFNATKQDYTSQVPLYHADNLGGGNHTLLVTNRPDVFGQALMIDYATVSNVGGNSPPSVSDPASNNSGSKSAGISAGAIGGIVAGAVVLLASLAALLLFWRRRRRSRETLQQQGITIEDKLPPNSYIYSPYPLGGTLTTSSQSQSDTFDLNSPPSTQLYGHGQPSSGPSSLYATNLSEGEVSHAPRPSSKATAAVLLPQTAHQSLSHIPASELAAERMVVEGRVQDFGAMPPNYDQATEPYMASR